MEGIKFGLKTSFLCCVRRAIARHLLLPLGVIYFAAGAACHAAPVIIESHNWKAANAGAGFPGLIAACGALIVFARIRRKKVVG
jgi:hypothetical protein